MNVRHLLFALIKNLRIAVGVVAGSELAGYIVSDWDNTRKAELKNK
mgnify:CR=1 FL=1